MVPKSPLDYRSRRHLPRPRLADFETWESRRDRFLSPEIVGLEAYGGLLKALEKAAGPDDFNLDFSRCVRAYPDGVLPIVSLIHGLRVAGCKIGWVAPAKQDVAEFFEAMNWGSSLRGEETSPPPLPNRTRSFVPARPYASDAEANELCVRAIDVMISQTRYAKWVADALYWAMWEVLENPLRHAMTDKPAWFQAVSYYQRRQVNFVVVDTGIGVLNSLREGYPELDQDHEALRQAVEFGVTRDRRVGQGNGLAGCGAIAKANSGRFTIWSGGGSLQIVGDTIERGPSGATHSGTIAELQLNTRRAIDLPDLLKLPDFIPMAELDELRPSGESTVFRVMDEVDGFGTRPDGAALRRKVLNLRSSAPDLMITLDFSGVPMVSSSFADEAIGKLAAEVGAEPFSEYFRLRGASEIVAALLRGAVGRRLQQDEP